MLAILIQKIQWTQNGKVGDANAIASVAAYDKLKEMFAHAFWCLCCLVQCAVIKTSEKGKF